MLLKDGWTQNKGIDGGMKKEGEKREDGVENIIGEKGGYSIERGKMNIGRLEKEKQEERTITLTFFQDQRMKKGLKID